MPPFLANSNEYMHGQSKNQVGYDMGQTCKSHSYWKQNTLCPKIGRTVDKDEHLFFVFILFYLNPRWEACCFTWPNSIIHCIYHLIIQLRTWSKKIIHQTVKDGINCLITSSDYRGQISWLITPLISCNLWGHNKFDLNFIKTWFLYCLKNVFTNSNFITQHAKLSFDIT
jgi:hypothetical protein